MGLIRISNELVDAAMDGFDEIKERQSSYRRYRRWFGSKLNVGFYFASDDDKEFQDAAASNIRHMIERLSIRRFGNGRGFVNTKYEPEKSGPEHYGEGSNRSVADALEVFNQARHENKSISVDDVIRAVHNAENLLRYAQGECATKTCDGAFIIVESDSGRE